MNYILDADIRSFFTEVSQPWVIRFLEHRVGDPRILRLVQKWLRAGVLEDGIVTIEEKGTGQGSVISPLLANVYLHYVFDLWAERWRRREATGDMIMIRYADDTVVGFQHESDARRFWEAMRDRLKEFSLSLHPDKTRLIGDEERLAAQRRPPSPVADQLREARVAQAGEGRRPSRRPNPCRSARGQKSASARQPDPRMRPRPRHGARYPSHPLSRLGDARSFSRA